MNNNQYNLKIVEIKDDRFGKWETKKGGSLIYLLNKID
jgi:hypothetical protein